MIIPGLVYGSSGHFAGQGFEDDIEIEMFGLSLEVLDSELTPALLSLG